MIKTIFNFLFFADLLLLVIIYYIVDNLKFSKDVSSYLNNDDIVDKMEKNWRWSD